MNANWLGTAQWVKMYVIGARLVDSRSVSNLE
jgi:hypothetical protein